jgi:hypothetical protein
MNVVKERLGDAVKELRFARDAMFVQILSVQHHRALMEANIGPMTKLVAALEASDPAKLAAMRSDFEERVSHYFENNHVRQDFLMTRATKN